MASDKTLDTPRLTRRAFFQGALVLVGTGGLITQWLSPSANAATVPGIGLTAFDLGDVPLTPGSRLAKATVTNANYLVSLSTDSLL